MTGDVLTLQQARKQLDKEVFAAIERQLAAHPDVWTITKGGHKAVLLCCGGCCAISVGGTIRNPQRAARDIARRMAAHPLSDGDPRSRRRDSTS